ncbi:hypothetical protein D3C75_551120 [compost metagenome]
MQKVLVQLHIFPREGWKIEMICKQQFNASDVNASYLCEYVWDRGYQLSNYEIINEE